MATDQDEALRQGRAAHAEASELVSWLRDRTVALRTALERTAQELEETKAERDRLTEPSDDEGTTA